MPRAALALLALAACSGDSTRVEHARAARYNADRSELVRRTADEVGKHYGRLSIMPDGTIRTAWHQVLFGTGVDRDLRGHPNEKRFIRFDITISTDRPASIEVSGYAAKWQTGMAVPTELRGADEPAWVQPRADRLRIQIHDALEAYAR
jgi:hypothetical protein